MLKVIAANDVAVVSPPAILLDALCQFSPFSYQVLNLHKCRGMGRHFLMRHFPRFYFIRHISQKISSSHIILKSSISNQHTNRNERAWMRSQRTD